MSTQQFESAPRQNWVVTSTPWAGARGRDFIEVAGKQSKKKLFDWLKLMDALFGKTWLAICDWLFLSLIFVD